MLFSAVNHAREWIAAELGRRMPRWWLEHAATRDRRPPGPQRAVVPPDPEPGRLRLHVHVRRRLPHRGEPDVRRDAGHRSRRSAPRHLRLQDRRRHRARAEQRAAGPALRKPTNRLWRKTLRDNDGNGMFGDTQDGVDPNRNYPTAWNLDEEGASNTFNGRPTAGRSRCPSPRTSPTTGCCAGSRRRASSTTTRPRSCCCTRSATSPTSTPTTTPGSRR